MTNWVAIYAPTPIMRGGEKISESTRTWNEDGSSLLESTSTSGGLIKQFIDRNGGRLLLNVEYDGKTIRSVYASAVTPCGRQVYLPEVAVEQYLVGDYGCDGWNGWSYTKGLNGNLICSFAQSSAEGGVECECIYDPQGRLLRMETNDILIEYTYDDRTGTGCEYRKDQTGQWYEVSTYQDTYDENNVLREQVEYKSGEAQKILRYDHNEHLLQTLDGNGQPMGVQSEYTYTKFLVPREIEELFHRGVK